MRKNLTIDQMAQITKENFIEARNLGSHILKEVPELENKYVAIMNYSYGDVKKFLNSAQQNYIKKSEMLRIMKLSESFKDYMREERKVLHLAKRTLRIA